MYIVKYSLFLKLITINKFYYWQKVWPVILFPVNKIPLIGFDNTILSLGLAICLKIKRYEPLLLNIKKVT